MKDEKHPLGSKENPIKCEGSRGEHKYLRKLVTQEGRLIKTTRQGSTRNASDRIVDIYPIEDENGQLITTLYFDMYHEGYEEKKVPAPLKSVNDFKKPQHFQKIDYLFQREKVVYANQKIEMPQKYTYLWSKAGCLLAYGTHIYAVEDFYHLPDDTMDHQSLIKLSEQIVHQLAGSHPSNPLIAEHEKSLSDLLKTYHFWEDLPDNAPKNEVFPIHTYHVMDDDELELFVIIK